jgi:hypothetical protein
MKHINWKAGVINSFRDKHGSLPKNRLEWGLSIAGVAASALVIIWTFLVFIKLAVWGTQQL